MRSHIKLVDIHKDLQDIIIIGIVSLIMFYVVIIVGRSCRGNQA